MCDSTPSVEVRLPSSLAAGRHARAALRSAGCLVHRFRLLDEAELLVSELVTNAVVHGAPPVTLSIDCDGTTGLTISVSDGSPRSPVRREAAPEATSGRGVALVDLLSDRWGVDLEHAGKVTWFQLRAPDPETPGES